MVLGHRIAAAWTTRPCWRASSWTVGGAGARAGLTWRGGAGAGGAKNEANMPAVYRTRNLGRNFIHARDVRITNSQMEDGWIMMS